MLRAAQRACLLLLLAAPASAAASVDAQDLSAAIRQLDIGGWSARMRTVHELEYMREAALPALAVASVDGDWQVRMAAVHALASLGPKATILLKSVLKNEPCPVVRLITLHDLGSQADEGAEEAAMSWIFSASSAQINDCRDQPAPGRAPWAAKALPGLPPVTTAASSPRFRPRVLVPTRAEPPDSGRPLTPDIPKRAAARTEAAPEAPPRSARYAELDALLAEPARPKESLGDAPKTARRPAAPYAPPASAAAAPGRPGASGEAAPPRRAGTPESLPRPVVTMPAPERAVPGAARFEAAGSKAPHDALPDLLLALKNGDVQTRSRAADELGSSGAAAGAAVPALVRALGDKSPRVRASAGLALGNIGTSDARVVPLLVGALKDKDADVRYAAALALSRIRTPAAREAFKKHIGEDARRAIER